MTIDQITQQVNATKPVSRRQVLRYLRNFEIRPVSKHQQRPQQYPEDAGNRILAELGLKVVSMPQLRRERAKAQKGRAA
jgi:hypothetical protein